MEAFTSCWAIGLMPTTTCTSKTSRSTKSSAPLLFNVLGGVPLMPSAPKNYRRTLVPGTWYTSTRYCCLRVWYFKAPPFAAIYSYGSFLSAGLELSPIYSSIIYVRKILPLLCTWYSSKYFGCLVRCIAKLVLDDNGQVFFHEYQENNSLRNRQSIAYNPFKTKPPF